VSRRLSGTLIAAACALALGLPLVIAFLVPPWLWSWANNVLIVFLCVAWFRIGRQSR